MTSQAASHPPAGLTLAEAAAALGLSPDAVRGRVRRGTLRARRVGGRWLVDLAAQPATRPATDQPDDQPPTSQGDAPLVRQLQTENTYLRAALERSQAGEAELRRLLAMQTPALPAATPSVVNENAPAAVAPTQIPSAPWWRFWRR